jgi:hypothetical protein
VERTIFVPVDSSFCIAVVVPDHKAPHNHPMRPMIKVSFDAKAAYRQCIATNRAMASTVKKVDNCKIPIIHLQPMISDCLILTAASSKLLLNGKMPGQAFPTLNNNCVKSRLIKMETLVNAPHGLGFMGEHANILS